MVRWSIFYSKGKIIYSLNILDMNKWSDDDKMQLSGTIARSHVSLKPTLEQCGTRIVIWVCFVQMQRKINVRCCGGTLREMGIN
uniref:Uncharacterized protein n=1 Tax=Oryzias sinensis TaxID=183150 RepID=A0A8C7ZMJ9_9TELE